MEEQGPAKPRVSSSPLEVASINGLAVEMSIELNNPAQTTPEKSNSADPQIQSAKSKRVVRRIYCSDGVYEEFSSDEDGVHKMSDTSALVDPKTLTWGPWIAHLSSKALAACDYVGETLADFLGITTPKYQYEIEEAKRMEEEAVAEKKALDLEMAGWTTTPESDPTQSSNPQLNSPVSILPSVAVVAPNKSINPV